MLSVLIALLERRGYAPSTHRRYATYIRDFAEWCTAQGLARLPTSGRVLSTYLRSLPNLDRRRIAALNAVFEGVGQRRLSERADLAEVLALVGLRRPRRLDTFQLRAESLDARTEALYQRRIGRYRRWCNQHQLDVSPISLERWVQSLPISDTSRAQYRTAVRAWAQMPLPPKSVEKSRPPAAKGKTAASKTRRSPLVLKTPEKRLLYQLSRTGVADHHRHAQGFSRVRARRLKMLERAGYLEQHSGIIVDPKTRRTQVVRYYSLGQRGRRWLEQQGVEHVYRWNPQQLRHDLQLTDVYCQLPATIQRTWMCETEIISQLRAQGRYRTGEAVDGAIIINNQPFAIEIAVGYKSDALARKQACIREVFGGRGLLIT